MGEFGSRQKYGGRKMEAGSLPRRNAENAKYLDWWCESQTAKPDLTRARGLNFTHTNGGAFGKVIPNPDDAPAELAQDPVHPRSPRLVGREFLPPERPVPRRQPAMLRTPMPETSVNEDHHPRIAFNLSRRTVPPADGISAHEEIRCRVPIFPRAPRRRHSLRDQQCVREGRPHLRRRNRNTEFQTPHRTARHPR